MDIALEIRHHAQDLLDFIDASPSPWHAVESMERRLQARGFVRLDEGEPWKLQAQGRYYTIRGGSSLIAFRLGDRPEEAGFRIVGAHTDSPGLRLKPHAPHAAETLLRLGVEIYGAPILATFADRDLSLAGRVCVRGATSVEARLIRFEQPLVRLPNLAIHMNRAVNEEGLKFNKQTELPLLLCASEASQEPGDRFLKLLAQRLEVSDTAILSFELGVYDTQPGAFWGPDGEFLADGQLDNLSSCHAALSALLAVEGGAPTAVGAFFDHEEIGSESHRGAAGSFLADVLERIAAGSDLPGDDYKRALARSFLISADTAHAHHPNFPNAYEPLHALKVNGGPAIKSNVNQRYATDGLSEARFMRLCEQAGVPFQRYAHRSDLACGSTIGPLVSARLGVAAVDCGCPLWAMHSLRESAGTLDQAWLAAVLTAFFREPALP
ncbi:M18 family aminopeptidase [Candidatus Methylocalor cossyra]|uniref:M18 family aminopeptidase n=1 Tax=Candidatus Methylocalor cossyra TaxID=3108543 RepID=A0ABP1C542_9GAMM